MAVQDCSSARLPALIGTDMPEQHDKPSVDRSVDAPSVPAVGAAAGASAPGETVEAAPTVAQVEWSAPQPKAAGQCHGPSDGADAPRGKDADDLEAALARKEDAVASAGEYIQSFVLGGLDGILSTFALVAGLGGAHTNVVTLLAVTLAKVIADAFSMGFGVYSSTSAELEHARQLKTREMWEVEHREDSELRGMCETYMQKGCSREDASTIMSIMMKYRELFVDHKMVLQHGVLPQDGGQWEAIKQGAVCFVSFIVFGLVPVAGFVLQYLFRKATDDLLDTLLFTYSFTALTLFGMGCTKAKLTGQGGCLMSGVVMVVNGTIAGGAAFVIGELLTTAF
mmetsp:Transcript_149081/g.387678  ORF Transcript_149081/g.387678 Transcript_149081/m.387678 type:complete len:339 (+) Transcript_149081:51-1067(+)